MLKAAYRICGWGGGGGGGGAMQVHIQSWDETMGIGDR